MSNKAAIHVENFLQAIFPPSNFSTKDSLLQSISLSGFLKWSLIKDVDNQSSEFNMHSGAKEGLQLYLKNRVYSSIVIY